MQRTSTTGRRRRRLKRGQCFALLALLIPAMIGVASLSVDLGVVELANSELKTVADAAALAGAKQLKDTNRMFPNFSIVSDMVKARQRAIAIGQSNLVLGQAAVISDNPTNLPTGDIVIGYKNMTVAGSAFDTTVTNTQFNSVRVVARRDASHVAVLPAFFSSALGFPGASLKVQSTATVQNYAITGFNCSPSGYTKLIPIALSKTTWAAMLAGQTTDSWTINSDGTVTSGADGLYESSMYPVGSGSGNWGTLQIGTNNNGNNTLVSQITNGLSTAEIGTMSPSGCTVRLNPSVAVNGNPGISLGIKPALQSLIGTALVVPIYDPATSSGNGANYTYTIVAFASVTVMAATFNGVHTSILIQPALIGYDPTMSLGSAQSSWPVGGAVRLRLTE